MGAVHLLFNRDEARATAASSALSRILQGAVKLPGNAKLGTAVGGPQNDLQAAGDLEEFQQFCNQEMCDGQAAGDVKFDRKVWQEGTTRIGAFGWKGQVEPGLEEVFGGGGSRENKEADEVEVMSLSKARGTLLGSSKQGVDADDGAATSNREGGAAKEGVTLPHGIRGMEYFGKWSSRWNRREDFGMKEGFKEFTWGNHNLGI